MPAYRFCRSDDIPLLVRAYNECYRSEFVDLPPMTIEEFKTGIRELDLWTSSCMVVQDGEDLIGVLLAAKREEENLIYRIGIHPDHRRREHGRHLLTSLSQKLAILGPRRLVAEVPSAWTHARAFIEACGYTREREYIDFFLQVRPDPPEADDFVVAVSLDDLRESGAFDGRALHRCWERARETLLNRRDRVRALAIASDERVEAYLLYHEPTIGETHEILGFGCARADRQETLLSLLLTSHCSRVDGPVTIKRVDPEEVSFDLLETVGFRPAAGTIAYAAEAGAA